MLKAFVCIFTISIFSSNCLARLHSIDSDLGVINFESDDAWPLEHNIFGMKNWLFSPKKNGFKSNLTVTNTKAKVELKLDIIKNNHKSYERLKSNWAKKVNAKVISFRPIKSFKNDHGHLVHKVGFSYLHKDNSYVENSYYVECRGTILFLKSLRIRQNLNHDKNFNKVINTLDCSL